MKIQTVYPDPENSVSSFGKKIEILGQHIVVSSSKGVYIIENLTDCDEILGGSAMLNSCEMCYGGTTGIDSLESEQACITSINTAINNEVQLHPNPVVDQLMVSLPINATGILVDIYGNHVKSSIQSGTNNVSGLKSGVYFLIVSTEGKREVVKVIKQ